MIFLIPLIKIFSLVVSSFTVHTLTSANALLNPIVKLIGATNQRQNFPTSRQLTETPQVMNFARLPEFSNQAPRGNLLVRFDKNHDIKELLHVRGNGKISPIYRKPVISSAAGLVKQDSFKQLPATLVNNGVQGLKSKAFDKDKLTQIYIGKTPVLIQLDDLADLSQNLAPNKQINSNIHPNNESLMDRLKSKIRQKVRELPYTLADKLRTNSERYGTLIVDNLNEKLVNGNLLPQGDDDNSASLSQEGNDENKSNESNGIANVQANALISGITALASGQQDEPVNIDKPAAAAITQSSTQQQPPLMHQPPQIHLPPPPQPGPPIQQQPQQQQPQMQQPQTHTQQLQQQSPEQPVNIKSNTVPSSSTTRAATFAAPVAHHDILLSEQHFEPIFPLLGDDQQQQQLQFDQRHPQYHRFRM